MSVTDTSPTAAASTSPPLEDAAEALFEEARQRARRRRRRAAGLVAALLIAATTLVLLDAQEEPSSGPNLRPAHRLVTPQAVLAREPYMGVSCRRPNSIACDRIGLAVWLRRPAKAVTAEIGARRFALDDATIIGTPKLQGVRRAFVGFLRPAGLRGSGPLAVQVENGRNRWIGVRPVRPKVRLTIVYPGGTRRTTELRIGLAPGWG